MMLGKKTITTQIIENDNNPTIEIITNTQGATTTISPYSNLNIESEKRVEKVLSRVHTLVMDELDVSETSKMSREELINHIRPIIGKILNEERLQLNAKEQTYLEKRLADDMIGLGPLEYLLADDTISDILVNNTNSTYIERFGKLEKSHIFFRDNDQILNVISRIVSIIGRRIDETNPYVDARLNDGSRVNAIISPLSIDGPCISIRKFRKQTMTMEDLVKNNTLSSTMAQFLEIAVKCRTNIIILGGAGSGKTTFLNALSKFISHTERIITIEDSAELQLQQPHVVRLETRSPNIEGKGAVTERLLLRNALRMRPDRIILGEIRGEEAFELLQAMNTGHDGSMSTIHASSNKEVPSRISNMVMMSGYRFPNEAILKQISDSINLLIQTNRMMDGKRRIVNISEIIGFEKDMIILQDLFIYNIAGETTKEIIGEFTCTKNKPKFLPQAKMYGLKDNILKLLGISE
jgi:pilus assembly protein CpaF